ncbi:hypothetical protein BT96DRAFT_1063404, partial [Gymnopus androsaceus JB14]
ANSPSKTSQDNLHNSNLPAECTFHIDFVELRYHARSLELDFIMQVFLFTFILRLGLARRTSQKRAHPARVADVGQENI